MRTALIILAQQGFQDHEYEGTRKGLVDADFAIVIGSKAKGSCTGKFGASVEATVALKDIVVKDYDRIAFIGGSGAAAYASDPIALKIANETVRANIPLGAICIAPTILAKAHVLEGKKATTWDDGNRTQIAFLEQMGAIYTGDTVTVDGLIVTGNGPEAAEEFGNAFASM
ncbi:MAG: protease I [Candidatus Peregrinibacteria bacterium Greene0416_62]|nr:MAG: protease I [Candidatus Peregrinibacteria bacterium Greene0416_62]TSC98640.1 MAG: protease I [Candidatus Peregrinibacteria bacterium Greene1014_49]